MSLRLSGAQITRCEEALTRYHENARISANYDGERTFKLRYIPAKLAMEELVEEILKEVLPNERSQICPEHRTSSGVSEARG